MGRSKCILEVLILKNEIENLELRLADAIRSSDLPFLKDIIHDDLLCLGPDGQTITKAMDMAAHESGTMVVEKLIPEILDISVIGDTAVSTTLYDTKGSMMGQSIEARLKYIRVWKKEGEKVRVIAAACLSVGKQEG